MFMLRTGNGPLGFGVLSGRFTAMMPRVNATLARAKSGHMAWPPGGVALDLGQRWDEPASNHRAF